MSSADALQFLDEHYLLIPLLGVPIYLVFMAAGKANTSIAWLLSASAPGLYFFVRFCWVFIAAPKGSGIDMRSYIGFFLFTLILFPITWISPVVVVAQIYALVRSKWRPVTQVSKLILFALVLLYIWSDYCIANIDNIK